MALDGLVVANLVYELNEKIQDGRIQKIAQPEKDELLLTVKKERKNYKLMLSAGAALPLVYLTENPKPSPLTAPNFCMLLRKHLNGAKITNILQRGMERVVEIQLENLNELGDLTTKSIIIELMGKHSNIIFLDDSQKVVDSIKHISSLQSSVRQVFPGTDYFIPNTQNKIDPSSCSYDEIKAAIFSKPCSVAKAIYSSCTGFSSLLGQQIAYSAGVDGDASVDSLSVEEQNRVMEQLEMILNIRNEGAFSPIIIFHNNQPEEFSCIPITLYQQNSYEVRHYDSISNVLETYYGEKEIISRIRQKSVDLRKVVTTLLERNRKKEFLQEKQLSDTEKREKYKVYGELLQTYGHQLKSGEKSLTCMNYYNNEEVTIPIDIDFTPMENANRYFNRYNKLKRTYEALTVQLAETKEEIEHLDSVMNALEIVRQEQDLTLIKEELVQSGYMRRKSTGKKERNTAKTHPMHFISSDGYSIYVGKNNYQNDELTFKFATGGDWWFHAKQMAGSHVVVKCDGKEPPVRTFEEAASLAAYFSKGRGSDKVEIDYTLKKNVKKPNGSKPGFVVYYTNYSMVASSHLHGITPAAKEDQVFLERSYL